MYYGGFTYDVHTVWINSIKFAYRGGGQKKSHTFVDIIYECFLGLLDVDHQVESELGPGHSGLSAAT